MVVPNVCIPPPRFNLAISSKKWYVLPAVMREPRKILIIRLSSLGDIILASPLIRVLRRNLPHAQIDFLVKPEFSEILRFNPHLSSIFELSPQGGLNAVGRMLRGERYDLLLDIHNSLRSRYLRWKSGAARVRVLN